MVPVTAAGELLARHQLIGDLVRGRHVTSPPTPYSYAPVTVAGYAAGPEPTGFRDLDLRPEPREKVSQA